MTGAADAVGEKAPAEVERAALGWLERYLAEARPGSSISHRWPSTWR
jgi:hypothetical protein